MNTLTYRAFFSLSVGLVLFPGACKRPEVGENSRDAEAGESASQKVEVADMATKEDPDPVDAMPVGEKGNGAGTAAVSKSGEVPNFPFERKLIDNKGRELNARVIGKKTGKIAFLRLPGKKRFVLSLEDLSDDDQVFFATIPDGQSQSKAESTNGNEAVDFSEKSVSKAGGKIRLEWLDDFDAAQEQAYEKKLPIYILFTDPSNPLCRELENKVLKSDEFTSYVAGKLILVKLVFSQTSNGKKQARDEVAKKFGVKSFPTFFVTDANGKIFGGAKGYKGVEPAAYNKKLDTFINVIKNQIPGIPSD